MAGKQHTFLVSFIAGKLQKRNYRIIYLDGKYVDCLIEKPEIPPTVINHRPDLIAQNDEGTFCIGEAKTTNDLRSQRTKNQFVDYANFVSINPQNSFIIGIPSDSIDVLKNVLQNLGIIKNSQISIFAVPNLLMSDIEEDEDV